MRYRRSLHRLNSAYLFGQVHDFDSDPLMAIGELGNSDG